MMTLTLRLALLGASLTACGEGEGGNMQAAAPVSQATTAPATVEQQVALGLTERQLRDAELRNARGEDIGDVEGVVRGEGGRVTHLLVEVEDTSPDRYVHVPLEGLEVVRDGDDWDIRSRLTREALMAMPEVRRR